MLTDQEITLAHSCAFDFAFGNLPNAKRAEFSRHLSGCRHCQRVIDEYSDIGRIIKSLPPHVEPLTDLEDRTVAAMVAALAAQRATAKRPSDATDQAATRVYPTPRRRHPVEPIPQLRPSPDRPPAPAEPPAPAMVTRLPVWRRYPRRLSAAAAAAAIIIAAIVVPLSGGGGRTTPAQATVVIPLHATAAAKVSGYAAATGQATVRQDASGSWNVTLTVHHLRNFGDAQWYQCWYLSRDRQKVASAGTFLVPESGSGRFSMTSAGYPDDFPTMEITLGPPSKNGALAGTVILSGQAL